ncbi:hypothetical protein [Parasphingorhabdus cellanae]|uniref:Uncharacterized protein n=1 Tax=Parasphingorhabdus cellanae TaxID=2806553 RepID=A0ABX7T5F8_9SPHN|nr:hypothetical protein [Parasphingorhabdus cellanae]QTD56366.1 hypothetical protein J4G78_01825 [Parasphingorhabdus cellanae]
MSEPKPLASLSSSLLARKGGAKPAMRRQGMAFPSEPDHETEDLGWNDMGYDTNPDHGAAQADAQGPVDADQYHYNPLAGAIPEVVPAVKKQQEEIAAKLSQHPKREEAAAAEPEVTESAPAQEQQAEPVAKKPSVPVPLSISREVAPVVENSNIGVAPPPRKKAVEAKKPTKKRRPAQKSRTRKAKAAFTLRLDADRHLKLRLATAVKNVSAQQLVTKAVDEYLRSIPELDDLAERIPSRGAA